MQRILQSARRLSVPVIVTDPAGREPMVILPLEQFEAMAGTATPPEPKVYRKEDEHVPVPQMRKEEEISLKQAEKPMEPPETAREIERLSKEIADIEGIPLEERFYLEPAGDEEEV